LSKLRAPLLSLDARGSIARALNYGRNLGGAIARAHPRASTAATTAQLARRQTYVDACAAWQLLTPEERSAWDAPAAARQITAFNAYLSDALSAGPAPPESPAIYEYTGADQSFTVPAGVTSITIKLWGAGGARGIPYSTQTALDGAGGGFATGTLAVTPAEELTIVVGGGGYQTAGADTDTTYGGGGGVGLAGAKGGGRSAVRRAGADIITAGAGGGGSSWEALSPGYGPGGGTTGGQGDITQNQCGRAGTPTAGGAGSPFNNCTAGAQYTGGNGRNAGGNDGTAGGGSGWYGGGGGNVGPGGGGSSYLGAATDTSTEMGADQIAAAITDPDYPGSVGNGGTAAAPTGEDGYVRIAWA